MLIKPLYYYLKVVFNITIPTFYRKISFRNRHFVSGKTPTLIAMNHPNAFMDPIAFATLVEPPMHYLARGDAFKKGLKPLLEGVGIIPIYRFMDFGREGMSKNDETFKMVTERLRAKDYVIIFPEGICIQERRLRPLKKGLARMAFTSLEELNDPSLRIIPVAMNYQNNPSKFRHTMFVNVGEPILVNDYLEGYKENSARATTQLTQLVQARMKELLVHIENKENDKLVEGIEEIWLDEGLESSGVDRFDLEKRHGLTVKIAEGVNNLAKGSPEATAELRSSVTAYLSEIKKLGIRDKLLRDKFENYSRLPSLLIRTLLLIAGIPLWIFGLVTNYIPYIISWKATNKIIKDVEWFAAVSMLMGTFLFQIWYIVQFLVVWFVFHDWKILCAFIVATVFCGWISLHYSPFRKKLFGSWRMFFIRKNALLYKRLIETRANLVSRIKNLIA